MSRATSIMTWPSRTVVDLLSPTLEMLDLRDIAHHLSLTNRFNGATRRPYSVAEHCIIGSYYAAPEFALEFLLHDAPEAYLGDVTGPLKRLLGQAYWQREEWFERLVALKWGLRTDPEALAEVKRVDRMMLRCEKHAFGLDPLLGLSPEMPESRCIRDIKSGLFRVDADNRFLLRHHELMAARYQRQIDMDTQRQMAAERQD
jgi:5'-deoxynucleotidase YfbR-like HD superfamily hydrolase